MSRLQTNNRRNATYSYRFYKKHRNDPKWHKAFIEARSLRRKEILFFSLVFLLVLMIGVGLFTDQIFHFNYPSNNSLEASKRESRSFDKISTRSSVIASSSSSSDKQSTQQIKKASAKDQINSTNESNNKELVQKYLIGNGFRIDPILFDGEDTDQAMEENKAPQNLAHDGIKLLLFKDVSTVTVKGVSAYFFPSDAKYNISDKFIIIGPTLGQIPYYIMDDKVEFSTWTTTNNFNGQMHSITWQIIPDNTVQSLIDNSLRVKAEEDASLKDK